MFSWNSTKRCFGNFLRLHKETFRGFCEIFKSSIKEVDSFEVWDERSIILVFLNLKFSAIGLEFIFAKHVMSLGFSKQLPLSWHFSLLFCTKCCLFLGQFSIFTFSGACFFSASRIFRKLYFQITFYQVLIHQLCTQTLQINSNYNFDLTTYL